MSKFEKLVLRGLATIIMRMINHGMNNEKDDRRHAEVARELFQEAE